MNIWRNEELLRIPVELYPAMLKTAHGNKWGFINSTGMFGIKPKFEHAMDFQENGLAVVEENNHNGLINQKGQFIIEPIYDSITPFSEGRAQVVDVNGFHVINEAGKILTSKPYQFISMYKNGRAIFSEVKEEKYLYGYLDRAGRVVIPAKYLSATDFNHQNKAIVQLTEKEYALINLQGKILKTYPYPYIGSLSEGLLAFKETQDGKYGYLNEGGQVVISPTFTGVQPFEYGHAVVNMSEDYTNQCGLINQKGEFVIKPIYNDINIVSNNRVSIGKAIKEGKPFYGSIYALATIEGKVLTPFKFYLLLDFQDGVASATDGKQTFFINKSGMVVKSLPIIDGEGTLFLEGRLIKANIDLRISYYDRAGKLVWQPNTVIDLNEQYKVVEHKYMPNKDIIIYYPQVKGIENKEAGNEVNQKLKDLSQAKPFEDHHQIDYSYTGDFSIEFFKEKLVVIEIDGYDFPFGAAHGMPYRTYAHINLENGDLYHLGDLFKENSDYVKVLSDIIGKQIKTDEQYSYVFPDSYKGISIDQPFYVDDQALYIYFAPYEIAPYAVGFPTFKIPYDQIMDIINAEGTFWRSFH